MPPSCLDTIVAVATPPGRGGISIIRLSGSNARTLSERLLRFRNSGEWQPRRVRSAVLVDGQDNPLDEVLATFFAGPRSYTGEDVVEISCHGSPVVVQHGVALALQAGARLAEPGEFTLRAYVSGRIDLPRAEAVRDLIEANTLFQARTAAQQLAGSLSRRVQPVKEKLLELIALLEAGIDFAEDDVDVAQDEEIQARLQTVELDLQALSDSFAYGRLVHEGLRLAIVGRPNVGKSSLFNQLMGEERAIVTDQPGTTRDTISETLAINGIPVRLVDTAGIRNAQDHIEALGVQRSYQAMADADVSLLVLDASAPLTPEDEALLEQVQQQGRYLIAASKSDLPLQAELPAQAFTVSAKTGQGIDALRHAITESALPPSGLDAQQGFLTNLRQRQVVDDSLQALAQARNSAAIRIPHEMLLRDCYDALRPIDMLTGATTADDILHRIFSTFCIGK